MNCHFKMRGFQAFAVKVSPFYPNCPLGLLFPVALCMLTQCVSSSPIPQVLQQQTWASPSPSKSWLVSPSSWFPGHSMCLWVPLLGRAHILLRWQHGRVGPSELLPHGPSTCCCGDLCAHRIEPLMQEGCESPVRRLILCGFCISMETFW